MKYLGNLFVTTLLLLIFLISVTYAQERVDDQEMFNHTEIDITSLDISDRNDNHPPKENIDIWSLLEDLTDDEKANANIELNLSSNASKQVKEICIAIEINWQKGLYKEAIELFKNLGQYTDPDQIEIGISWQRPLTTTDANKWGSDVRIGNRDYIYETAFDIHWVSGNLFAVLLFDNPGGTAWAVYISTDKGQTWNETYYWNALYQINSITAGVADEHLYVIFSRGSDQDQALVYRFDVTDGARVDFPDASQYQTAFTTTSPESIEEVRLVTNQDYESSTIRLYLAAITSDDNLKFYWDDENANSWSFVDPLISDADKGLSICINENYSDYWTFMSYIDSQDSLNILGFGNTATWDRLLAKTVNGTFPRYTSIGAYNDTVHCVYEFNGVNLHNRYQVSYTGGNVWLWGTVEDTTTISESPALSAREGGGVGIIWRYYSTPREGRFTWRNYGGWPWPTPKQYTDQQPYYNQPSISYVGNQNFGVVYLSWHTPEQGAFYDRGSGCCNVRGDALHDDGLVLVNDLVHLVNYVFKGGPPPPCLEEGDVVLPLDGLILVNDLVFLVNYVFKGGPPPPGC